MPKLLCCGSAGFLGSWVCQVFKEAGWFVVGLDSLSKYELSRTSYNVDKARDYNVKFLESIGVIFRKGDIRNYADVWLAAQGCDYIINCAAQPAMTIALEDPILDAENNIMGVLNILEVGKRMNILVVLCLSVCVFG